MSMRTILARQAHLNSLLEQNDPLYLMTKPDFDWALKRMPERRIIRKDGTVNRILLDFIPHQYYHLTHHLAEQLQWGTDEEEQVIIHDSLIRFAEKYHMILIAWNIMSNHLHLITRTTARSRVSKFMQAFLSSAVQRINRKRLREALQADAELQVEPPKVRFQGRFNATLLLDAPYLQSSCVYVFTNAEKAAIPDHVGSIPRHNWAGFKKTYGTDTHRAPGGMTFAEAMVGVDDHYEARRAYWIRTRGVRHETEVLPSLHRRKQMDVMDEVIRDLTWSTPGWIRKRIRYDPARERW